LPNHVPSAAQNLERSKNNLNPRLCPSDNKRQYLPPSREDILVRLERPLVFRGSNNNRRICDQSRRNPLFGILCTNQHVSAITRGARTDCSMSIQALKNPGNIKTRRGLDWIERPYLVDGTHLHLGACGITAKSLGLDSESAHLQLQILVYFSSSHFYPIIFYHNYNLGRQHVSFRQSVASAGTSTSATWKVVPIFPPSLAPSPSLQRSQARTSPRSRGGWIR
jgi:hypothetical protein